VVAVEAQLALAEPAGASRHTLEAERVPERARRRRKVTHRRRQLAGRVDLSHARDSDACPPTHVGDERRERAIEHLGVRIEEEQPRRVARRRADVVRMRVAAVLADDDARVWEVALDESLTLASWSVVDDDDIEREIVRVLEDRRKTARQPA